MDQKIAFTAPILQHGEINAAYVEFPFSVEEIFGTKGQVKVMAKLDGTADYRGSLANMGTGCHALPLPQAVRRQIGKTFGDPVSVVLWKDTEERTVAIPEDVQKVFDEKPDVFHLYSKMSYTNRKEYMRWICEAKKPETRESRKTKLLEMIRAGRKGI